MRIEEATHTLHNLAMDETTADALMQRATDLAYDAFSIDTTDDHIEAVYERLVSNWQWGAGDAGVVTVH